MHAERGAAGGAAGRGGVKVAQADDATTTNSYIHYTLHPPRICYHFITVQTQNVAACPDAAAH